MKFCYIISTCDKYIDTRVKYQMEVMFKNTNKNDIYYLTSKPNIENRQFGWLCADDEKNITWKYIHFFYNMEIPHYDWYVFIDDDTFVFHERLQNILKSFNHLENYYIGKELDHIKNAFGLYMSGGAGYVISNSLYAKLHKYVKTNGINNCFKHWCDDLCVGLWIQEISKDNKVFQLNNNNFHLGLHKNNTELKDAITFHKVETKEQYDYYNAVYNGSYLLKFDSQVELKSDTTFVIVTDSHYYSKAKRTIADLRSKGNWQGDVVVISIDFDLNTNFKDFYNITELQFNKIDKTNLLANIGPDGFIDSTDKREINKLVQWEKLHVFDDYFRRWQRVVYLDAGLRVFDDVKYLLELDYKNKLLAPTDGNINEANIFKSQISYSKPELINDLIYEYGDYILDSKHMLNCIWIYDTDILNLCNKTQLIEAMNKYTFCKTNEMGIMNLMFHFKYKLWDSLPVKASNNKILFDWCELNQKYPTTWRDYCFIKYPVSIKFEDT